MLTRERGPGKATPRIGENEAAGRSPRRFCARREQREPNGELEGPGDVPLHLRLEFQTEAAERMGRGIVRRDSCLGMIQN